MRSTSDALIDAVAVLATARRGDPAELAGVIDEALASEHSREVAGWLVVFASARLGKRNVKRLAKIVAAQLGPELIEED